MLSPALETLCLDVARDIMLEAHAGQTRNDGIRPASEHLLTVEDILRRLGCNSVQRAVGLLHDTVEDNGIVFADAGVLYGKLTRRIAAQLPPDDTDSMLAMMGWAGDVCEGVHELTNSAILYEGKRSWQVDNAAYMQNLFKPVKIIDQAASVIDGLRYAQSEDFDFERGFALKGLDVATACATPECRPFYEFYKHAYACLHEYIHLHEAGRIDEAQALRDGFDLERHILDSLDPDAPYERSAERVTHCHFHDYVSGLWAVEDGAKAPHTRLEPSIGLERITLSEVGDFVVGFGMVVSHNIENLEASQMAERFRDVLESPPDRDGWNRVLTGPIELRYHGIETHEDDVLVRDFSFKPRLKLDKFIELAQQVGAIDPLFSKQLLTQFKRGGIGMAAQR